jgi:hypothetical protein
MALIHALNERMDVGCSFVGALLIDLSKAFDMVSHQKLVLALAEIGCSIQSLSWFNNYLSNRFQRVVQRTDVTEWKSVSRGVPQGSPLGSHSFNIYARKLPHITQSSSMQYADDLTISEAARSLQDIAEKLAQSFHLIQNYCQQLDLEINTTKSQLIIFKVPARKIPTDFEVCLGGCSIKPNPAVKLLGVTLDQHFTFANHMDNVSKNVMAYLVRLLVLRHL